MIVESMLGFGETFFDVMFAASVKTLVVVPVVWLVVRASRVTRPSVEHGVWTATMLVMLALPAIGVLTLDVDIAPIVTVEAALPAIDLPSASESTLVPASSAGGELVEWRGIAGALIGFVGLLFLVRLAWVRRRVTALVDRAVAVTDRAVVDELQRDIKTMPENRPPRIVETAEVSTPVAFEGSTPTIILPVEWREWTRYKLRAVLLHELAHLARHDGRGQSLAAVNTALFWFHPAAYFMQRRLKLLAEQACDDQAINVAADKEGYAETLLELARGGGVTPAAVTPMAHGSSVSARIERILAKSSFESGVLSRTTRRKLFAAAATVALAVSIVAVTFGQEGGVTFSGTVNDPSGARIPGAYILISAPAQGIYEGVNSGDDGSFSIAGLQSSSDYQIEVAGQGFKPHRQAIDLSMDQAIDITLTVGQIYEEIVVSGTRPEPDPLHAKPPKMRIRVGGNVQKAKLIHHVPPIYPTDAERDGVEGTVLLEAVISKDGVPTGLRTINSVVDARLVVAASDAIRQWRYQPTQLNGEPVEVITSLKVTFQLP